MKKRFQFGFILLVMFCVAMSAPAWAKKEGNPAGWSQGKKTGWDGGSTPPGLAKKEAHQAKKEAHHAAKKAAHEAKANQPKIVIS